MKTIKIINKKGDIKEVENVSGVRFINPDSPIMFTQTISKGLGLRHDIYDMNIEDVKPEMFFITSNITFFTGNNYNPVLTINGKLISDVLIL